MADNVTIPATGAGDATPIVATDKIGGVDYQRVKLTWGVDGTATDASASNPLPIIGASNSGIDIGDVTINNASGASAVNIQDGGNSITVDNGGTFVVQDSQVIADNGGFTDGTSKVFVAGFIYDEVAGTALTENDAAASRIDVKRAQVMVIEDQTTRGRRVTVDASGNMAVIAAANSGVDIGDVTINNASGGSAVNIQDGGNSITVDGTVATNSERAEDTAHTTGQIGNFILAVRNDNQGAFTDTDADYSPIAVDSAGRVQVVGGKAHDVSFGTSNPQAIGGYANATMPTEVGGDARAVRGWFLRGGQQATATVGPTGNIAAVTSEKRLAVSQAGDGVTVSGNVLLAPLRQPINISAGGSILVSGQANRKIRVLNGVLVAAAAVNLSLKSNNNTDVTGPLPLGANGGFQIPHAELGDFETNVGENLTIALSANTNVGGWITYVLV